MASIAFIGLGNMGGPMAANLVKAGHKVAAFDLVETSRNQAKADGASIADSAAGSAKGADVVITMLPAGKHVISVWTDVVPSMTKGTLIIDCSTIDVESAKQAHALAAKHGIASVDAPVSGGTGGAKGATLTFMCGGEDKAFGAAKPVLENMGKKIVHCGGAGAGQAAKICKFLGDISYPLYITHYPLIYIYTAWVVDNKIPLGVKGLLVGLLVVLAGIGLAFACLKLYDEPVREWLKKKVLVKR